MKIDRRINYKLVLDTETCPMDRTVEGVDPMNMLTYDIGWTITDKRGNIYRTRSFINRDIFMNETELMQSSYYADKIPKYWEDIKTGNRVVANWYTILKTLREDMAEFEIKEVYAYNMRFDYYTTAVTQRWLTKSKYRYVFPYETEICDIMKMARDVIAPMPTYKRFCEQNGYLTKNGRLQLKAETVYRFILNNTDFVESHTALEDAQIETVILAYCYKQKKKMRRKLWD